MDFYRYFHVTNKVLLENVSYETAKLPDIKNNTGIKMNCKDTVVAQIGDAGVKFNFNRKVDFEPECMYTLSVTFSAYLPFRPEFKDEVDWKSVDISSEFVRAGGPVLTALMSKTSLLIGEITAAGGQNPLITPPSPQKKEQ